MLLSYPHVLFPPGVVSVTAGAAPAEGGVSASAARQAAGTEEGTAENQADNHTGGGTCQPYTSTHHTPGKYKLFLPSCFLYIVLWRGQRSDYCRHSEHLLKQSWKQQSLLHGETIVALSANKIDWLSLITMYS